MWKFTRTTINGVRLTRGPDHLLVDVTTIILVLQAQRQSRIVKMDCKDGYYKREKQPASGLAAATMMALLTYGRVEAKFWTKIVQTYDIRGSFLYTSWRKYYLAVRMDPRRFRSPRYRQTGFNISRK
jgi:hypothetical protein